MNLKLFKSKADFTKTTLDFISSLCQARAKKMVIRIALSGGATPKPIYQAMSKRIDIPFEKIHFFQVDERYVRKTDSNSNFKMINESLIKPLKKGKDFYSFDTNLTIEESLRKYEKNLKNEHMEGFDLTILGMGDDGHIASLFPNTKALKEKKRLVAHTITKKFKIKDRLTLTFPAILNSKSILLLLKGKEKKKILNDLLNSNKTIDKLPAKALLNHKKLNIFYLGK